MPTERVARKKLGRKTVTVLLVIIGTPAVWLVGALTWYVIIRGSAAAAEWAFPILTNVFRATLFFVLPFLLLLAVFPRTRIVSAIGMMTASCVFGFTTWVWGFLLTLSIWGWLAVLVGFVLAGVGFVPLALLATALHGMWSTFWSLLLCLALIFGSGLVGAWIGDRA
jgi:hypothetical protein